MVGGKKVYEAIAKGDVKTFEGLLQEDPYLLDTKKKVIPCIQDSPPLHTATMQGNRLFTLVGSSHCSRKGGRGDGVNVGSKSSKHVPGARSPRQKPDSYCS